MSNTFLKFIRLTKVDVAKREVYGVVTSEAPDKDGEICDYETTVPHYQAWSAEFEKSTDGKSLGNIREMHDNRAAGKVTCLEFDDVAREIRITAKIVDDDAWKKCEEGVYTGFSHGGEYVKVWTDGGFRRYTAKPNEISLVDNPCNPEAHFEYVKADGTIELRKFFVLPAEPAPDQDMTFAGGDSRLAATSPPTADTDPAAPPADQLSPTTAVEENAIASSPAARAMEKKGARHSRETLATLSAMKKCHDTIAECHAEMAKCFDKLLGRQDEGELADGICVEDLVKAVAERDAELTMVKAENLELARTVEQVNAELKKIMAEPKPPKGFAKAIAVSKDQDKTAEAGAIRPEGMELLKAIHRGEV
jgi:hypothetical protein